MESDEGGREGRGVMKGGVMKGEVMKGEVMKGEGREKE